MDFQKQIDKIEEKCHKNRDGNMCAKLGFKYSTKAFQNDKDIKDALNCLKYENYKKSCFYYGENIGEDKYLF